MLKGIHHVAVICSDYKKSRDFYVRILGLEVLAEHYRESRDSWKLDLKLPDGCQIELFSFPSPPARPGYPEARGLRHLAFAVSSVEEFSDYLNAFDVSVEPIRMDKYTGRKYTFFKDPDGLPLEIYESRG